MQAGYVGVDFGATSVKLAFVDSERRTRRTARRPTAELCTPERAVRGLTESVRELSAGAPLLGVGVGFCGFVDKDRGRVLETTETLPGWRDVPLAARLEERLGCPVMLDNDGNAHALAEARRTKDPAQARLIALVLGTGVGGGIIMQGRLHRGAAQRSTHLGHLKVRPRGRRCACGARGCLEAYASAWAARAQLGAEPREVFARAAAGEARAQAWVKAAAEAVGRAAADLANVLCPERIVVGGGLARGWAQLGPIARRAFDEETLPQLRPACRLVKSRGGAFLGAEGAAGFPLIAGR